MSQLKRQCNRELQLGAKASRRIVLPIEVESYQQVVQDAPQFRQWVENLYATCPELFPETFKPDYHLHDLRVSRKLPEVGIRLPHTGEVYRVVPSFVLPYMTGYTADVEKALFLRRFGVPF